MCTSPVDASNSSQYFGALACAVTSLHKQNTEWTEDELISILDEMASE
jgi:hypothetical protein